ncbi:unnamed protein product [Camellia sinensis]
MSSSFHAISLDLFPLSLGTGASLPSHMSTTVDPPLEHYPDSRFDMDMFGNLEGRW